MSETMTFTQFIPEEDLIDGLFYRCDVNRTGRVSVSDLIRYLKSTAGQSKQSLAAIENLSSMLDPKQANITIDLLTYRKGINQWIRDVRKKESDEAGENSIRKSLRRQNAFDFDDRSLSTSRDEKETGCGDMNISTSTLDASSQHLESEISELTSQIHDLQHQNRKLSEENNKLQCQMESQEESFNIMNQETLACKKKIKSLQTLVYLRSQTQEENEELKTSLARYQERRKELENRLNQVERDNTSLLSQIADYENKVQTLSLELESASTHQQSLQATLAEQKQLLNNLAEERAMYEVQLSEKQAQIQELGNYVEEQNKLNEQLKHENNDLQVRLIQVHHEVKNCHLKDDKPNVSSSSGCVDDLETLGDMVSSSQSTAHSTPVKEMSIHNELKDMLGESPDLLSPLSDKEQQESILTRSNSSGTESWTTEELLDLNVESSHKEHGEDRSLKILEPSKLIEKFRDQQRAFSNQVEEVINSVALSPEKSVFVRQLFPEPNLTNNHPTEDLKLKKTATERVKELTHLVEKLKCENSRLLKLHDEAVESLSNWEQGLDSSVDNRLTTLRDMLLKERALRKQHQEEVLSLRVSVSDYMNLLKEKEVSIEELQFQLMDVDTQVANLKRTNVDLAEKCHKSELKVVDLQEDLVQSSQKYDVERIRGCELEETLASTKLARQLDLHDIWRLVQKEVENECMDEQKDSPLSSSTDILKEQIAKEIESLKDRLVKRQAALGVLKGNMQLRLDSSNSYGCHNPHDVSPSSPLVDALTLDFFNGNYLMAKQYKRASTLSSLNQYTYLEQELCETCLKNNNVPYHHTLSCPSLHQRHCQNEYDYQGNILCTNLNTSSSSSTSGVDVSPRSLRSVDGQNRRRDFIRSSVRYGSGSQASAESNANSDSTQRRHKSSKSKCAKVPKKEPDPVGVKSPPGYRRLSFMNAIENRKDNNDNNMSPFTRSRSLSFQVAIERGQKSSVDDVDYLSTSVDSMPEKYEHETMSKSDGKSVSFHLSEEEFFDTCSDVTESENNQDATETDSGKDTTFSSPPNRQPSVTPARKLSTLIEEDLDLAETFSDKSGTPAHIKSIVEQYATPSEPKTSKCTPGKSETSVMSKSVQHEDLSAVATKLRDDHQRKEGRKTKKSVDDFALSLNKGITMEICPPSPTTNAAAIVISTPEKVQVKGIDTLMVSNTRSSTLVEEPKVSPKMSPKVKSQSRLAKIRQNNLAKKREQMRTMKLPELREQSEGDISTPQVLTVSENTISPPPPSADPVTPSLPNEFLAKLGLTSPSSEDQCSVEELPENEVEGKFGSLALAFKTDKLTLDTRRDIQERSRDLAETNFDEELKSMRVATEELNRTITDAKLRDVIQKIQGHVEILVQTAAKVSSSAEVFGAVQQEARLSKAMEIMITYVNHLKTMYEKEHGELEEARKHLNDKPFGGSVFGDFDPSNRSKSVALNVPYKMRRRSEIALPRMCGGVGSPNLKHSTSLDHTVWDRRQQGWIKENGFDCEDNRQKFQAAVGSAQMRNKVAETLRRGSLERQSSVQSSKSSTSSISRENSSELNRETKDRAPSKQGSQEEEAYQRGFEDGVKAKLGQELNDLREKQNQIGNTLEDVMDKVERSKEEEEREKEEAAEHRMKQMRAIGLHKPSWEQAARTFRLAVAGLIFMIAVGMVIMTILPGSATGMEIHTDIQHLGAPPV